jgi:hypothetical protein
MLKKWDGDSIKMIIALALLLGCSHLLFAQEQSLTQKTDELLTAYARLGQFNGSALVAWKGGVILEKGYGFKNRDNNTFNDAHTIGYRLIQHGFFSFYHVSIQKPRRAGLH